MKVLICGHCYKIIKPHEPFWQAYYSKQVFCCAACAAIAQGCTHYVCGDTYDRIFTERSIDDMAWKTIRANLDIPDNREKKNESSDYRFDLDY